MQDLCIVLVRSEKRTLLSFVLNCPVLQQLALAIRWQACTFPSASQNTAENGVSWGTAISLRGPRNIMLVFKVSTLPGLLDLKALMGPQFLKSPCLTGDTVQHCAFL